MVKRDDGTEHITWNERTLADDVPVTFNDDRAGGKCMRFPYMGRTYELGAAVTTLGYKRVHALMKRSRPNSSMSFFDRKPNSFSTSTSTHSPWQSKPF